jgi:hypothetical protein
VDSALVCFQRLAEGCEAVIVCVAGCDVPRVREWAQPWWRPCRWLLLRVGAVGIPSGLRDSQRRLTSSPNGEQRPWTCVRAIRSPTTGICARRPVPGVPEEMLETTVTMTPLIVVNVALIAASLSALDFAISWPARLTPHRPAASSTAPPLWPGATELPRGLGLTHFPRAARPVRSRARARVRT